MATTADDHGLVRRATPWLWGAILTTGLTQAYFGYGPGEMHVNHEGYAYVHRVMEFADLLRAGYLSPQWAVDFRKGLGSPYFGYYQPLFFYLASALAFVLPLPTAIATSVWTLVFAGYAGMLALVRRRFGTSAGMLAGTVLLCARYLRTEIYFRGDLSELTGMMLLPAALHWTMVWLDEGRRTAWYALALLAAALVCAHPVAGLFGWGAIVAVIASWVAMGADARRGAAAFAALGAGVGLASFYLAPIVLEWNLVQGGRLTFGDAPLPFVDVGMLVGMSAQRFTAIPVALGGPILLVLAIAGVGVAKRWRALDDAGRRTIVAMAVVAAGVVLVMHPWSQVLWDALPFMHFVQFPARGLLALTVALAALVGALAGRSTSIAVVAAAIVATPVLFGIVSGAHIKPAVFEHPDDARGLAATYVAPDGANEWLPRGADVLLPGRAPAEPTCTGTCSVPGFQRSAGRLRTRVTFVGRTEVTLPHYYFPVGWRATLDGVEIPLARGTHGLMQVTVGEPGHAGVRLLDVRFFTTPARRLGIAISSLTALALLASAFVLRRRRAHLVPRAEAE